MVTQSEILLDNIKISALNNSNTKVKHMSLSSKLLQNMNIYHIFYHNTVVYFQRMPYLAWSYVHYKCPTGFKDLTMNSAPSVRPSVTTFSKDWFISFFLIFYMKGNNYAQNCGK